MFQILSAPDGSSETLIEKGAVLGAGQSMEEFLLQLDGSKPVFEFRIPPEEDPFYNGDDRIQLTEVQMWVLAKLVHEAFRAGFDCGRDPGQAKSVYDRLREKLGLGRREA